jgi:hypothetical protein
MGVSVKDKIVVVPWFIIKPMWEHVLWYPGSVRLGMLVGDGQLNHLVTRSEQEI